MLPVNPRFLRVRPEAPSVGREFSPCPIPHCAGSPMDMLSSSILSECEECVTECDTDTCDLGTENPQCTDRCLVIPCEDPCLDVCATGCSESACGSLSCPGYQSPAGGRLQPSFQGSIPSTSISHGLLWSDTRDATPNMDWNNASLSGELDALICACSTQLHPHSFNCNTCDPRLLDKAHPQAHDYSSTFRPASAQISGIDTPAQYLSSSSSNASPTSTPDSPYSVSFGAQGSSSRADPRRSHVQAPDTFECLWAECGKSFLTPQDLISHVNASHLHLPIPPGSLPQRLMPLQTSLSPPLRLQSGNTSLPGTGISCMWGNCNVFSEHSCTPGGSSDRDTTSAAQETLANHLLQDHLGVPVSRPVPSTAPGIGLASSPTISASTLRSPPPPLPSHSQNSSKLSHAADNKPQHRCLWQVCIDDQRVFASSADLTTHIADVHVGGGKNKYECLWEGCNRNGATGFSSKQKILRHIQSHTGHRPFRCELCDQLFSEAATLQQHIRRHTKEKPYICDFPGCNKSFAITGALTIHKRTHSGTKPFKCMYCDRSFSESSNLSKHIRTHTGDRPYHCSFPGCGKRFARPDQVARHMHVHNKKLNAGSNAGTVSSEMVGNEGMHE